MFTRSEELLDHSLKEEMGLCPHKCPYLPLKDKTDIKQYEGERWIGCTDVSPENYVPGMLRI